MKIKMTNNNKLISIVLLLVLTPSFVSAGKGHSKVKTTESKKSSKKNENNLANGIYTSDGEPINGDVVP